MIAAIIAPTPPALTLTIPNWTATDKRNAIEWFAHQVHSHWGHPQTPTKAPIWFFSLLACFSKRITSTDSDILDVFGQTANSPWQGGLIVKAYLPEVVTQCIFRSRAHARRQKQTKFQCHSTHMDRENTDTEFSPWRPIWRQSWRCKLPLRDHLGTLLPLLRCHWWARLLSELGIARMKQKQNFLSLNSRMPAQQWIGCQKRTLPRKIWRLDRV